MHYVVLSLVLLLAVALSGMVCRLLPLRLPLPLVQIAIGALLGGPLGVEIPLDPQIFFLLFIPPLLFLDGWRIPKGAFVRDLRPILILAVGLVIFTVIGVGYFVHWLLPAMPAAVAFAVAAILAPTDPVAVAAVRGDAPMPPRLKHVLEGEALLNDASGLACFRFAVLAVVTGSFSLSQTALGFVWLAAAGVVIGTGVGFACGYLLRWVGRVGSEDSGVQVLVSLLVPFAAYLAAEPLGASGILAAASAGIATQYVNLHGPELSETRMQRAAVWKTVQDVLNGIIFVLLGEQLVRVFRADLVAARHSIVASDWTLLLYILAIAAVLLALRFVWVSATMHLSHVRRDVKDLRTRLLLMTTASVAGVRGAVTMAGVLSLPLLLPGGAPFPARHLAIVIAMGVILVSLLLASIALPRLVRSLPPMPHLADIGDERSARVAAAQAAVQRLEELLGELEQRLDSEREENEIALDAAGFVLQLYYRRLAGDGSVDDERIWVLARAERDYQLAALAAEREKLFHLRFERQIDDELHRKLLLEVDLLEASLCTRD
ncbi:Na+/H+ antiporter [Microbulbifer hainanensis]|uniref:Na+/H+ antiporter n=1 Tax=Microbulbifer hainanensis TaxID=2735675 RepID=UPI001866FD6A|nr:Na+/H+ antiporter [Microbulbifer hainanensis]